MRKHKGPAASDDPFDPFVREKESFRPAKVANRIREELMLLVPDALSDPRMKKVGSVTVTDVTCTQDLRNASVKFTILGYEALDEDKQRTNRKLAESILNAASRYLRKEVHEKLGIKYTPVLSFHFDKGLSHTRRVHELLQQIHKSDEPTDQSDSDDSDE